MDSSGLRPDAFEPRATHRQAGRSLLLVGVGAAVAGAAAGVFLLARRYVRAVPSEHVVVAAWIVGVALAIVVVAWMLRRIWAERDEPGAITPRDVGHWVVLWLALFAVSSAWPAAPDWALHLATGALAALVLFLVRQIRARGGTDLRRPPATRRTPR